MTALDEARRAVMEIDSHSMGPGQHAGGGSVSQLAALAPLLRDLLCGEGGALELLEKLEWVQGKCAWCREQRNWGHAAGCILAAFLRRAAEELGASAPQAGGAG